MLDELPMTTCNGERRRESPPSGTHLMQGNTLHGGDTFDKNRLEFCGWGLMGNINLHAARQ